MCCAGNSIATRRTHVRSVFAPGIVGILSEVAKIVEEALGLADEQSVIGEGSQRRHRRGQKRWRDSGEIEELAWERGQERRTIQSWT